MPASTAKNFDRATRAIRVAGWPLARFTNVPTSQATMDALEKPCVIASNHRSVFDAVAGIHAVGTLGHRARVLSAARLWDHPRLGRLLDGLGAIPLESGRAGMKTIESAIACLQEGSHLLITPEGRVVPPEDRPDGVGSGHKILSKIALGADAMVIPGALVGTDDLWPLGRKRPHFRPWDRPVIGFGFADPIRLEGCDHRANVDRTLAEISALIKRIDHAVSDSRR
jgi:1-acyl-sn-glycerol-3-phosphate acyltransferase